MKYAIISDIHANADALRRVLKHAHSHEVDAIVCLGDIVGYGPLPAETFSLVQQECAISLAGNHDDAVCGRADASDFIDLAGDAVLRHREALDKEALTELASLPYVAKLDGGAIATHGDLVDPPKFYYVENEKDAEENFNATDAQLIFVGHTHVPAIFLTGASGKVYRTDAQDFMLEDGKRYIVNPGSVGYPRENNGECFSSYVIYDSDERSITFRYLPFAVSSVMQRGHDKRIRRRILIAIAAGIAIVAGAVAYLFAPRTEVMDDPAMVVITKTIPLTDELKHVRANLTLDKDSCPVNLKIVFKDERGMSINSETFTVKRSSTKELPIPLYARSAEFLAIRNVAGDQPSILGFSPTASSK